MKRLLLMAALLFSGVGLYAQPPGSVIPVSVDPPVGCFAPVPLSYNYILNKLWGCVSGTSTVIASGSSSGSVGPAGTVQTSNGSGGFRGNGFVVANTATRTTDNFTVALAGAGAGNVGNGSYNYIVTYTLDLGNGKTGENTSDQSACDSFQVTVTDNTVNGKVALSSLPLGPSNTLARNIYRSPSYFTTAGAACNFQFLVATLNDNTTTSYVDNTADGALGAPWTHIDYSGGNYDQVFLLNPQNGSLAIWPEFGVSLFDNTIGPIGSLGAADGTFGGGGSGGIALSGNGQNAADVLISLFDYAAGAINPGIFSLYATTSYGSVNASKFGAGWFCVDGDFAAVSGQAGNTTPCAFSVFNANDGTDFIGGYPTSGGFVGVNKLIAPASAYFEVAGTVIPTRGIIQATGGVGQSGPLFSTAICTNAACAETSLPFSVDSNGVIVNLSRSYAQITALTLADGAEGYMSDGNVTSGLDDTCTSGGSGASYVKLNGVFRCRI